MSTETDAILTDATRRLAELRAIRQALLPDRDDPEALSELLTVESQIRSAERTLAHEGPAA